MKWLFGWLYGPIGTMLSWFSSLFGGSYALALLLYALLFKIVFLPFSIKQQKNQIKMAKLTPQLELIKAKYAGRTDAPTKQKMQQEIMEFQQKEGYNPLSGCLPMLLQFPIIIFLYDIIQNPLTYICKLSDEAVLKIHNLLNPEAVTDAIKSVGQIKLISQINEAGINVADYGAEAALPNFELFGINLAAVPNQVWGWLTIIPIAAAVLTWLSMVLTKRFNGNANQVAGQDAQAQASGKIMDLVMPAITLFIGFSLTGMMGVYWIYQSLFGIIQMFILAKVMPLPRYTEEEIKAMKKAQKNAEKQQRQVLKEMPKYRSLHYIDEDDYEELPDVKKNDDNKKSHGIDLPEIKD